MAQDSKLRHSRSDEAYSGDSAPVGGGRGNDPLAELARLIGQNDPFVDMRRQDPAGSARSAGGQRPAAPQGAPDWLARSAREAEPDRYEDPDYRPEAGYQEPQYAANQGAYAGHGPENPAYDDDANAYYDDQLPPQGEEGYDEAPVEKRRGGLTTIAAVVALAILGTGGVYGYRAWTGPSGPAGEPPVIKAEQAPTKVVPAAPSGDNQLNKQIYDRVGDRGGEKVVLREEQPVDVRNAVRQTSSGLGTAGSTGSVLPPLGAQPQSAAAGTEPKKVKTVPIRPEQSAGGAAASPPTRSIAATQATPAPTAAPTRVATIPIQPSAARPAPAASEGGNYVQVSSQYKESEALASFKVLQGKYPDLLAGQRVTVQRVDLSERGLGVRYRAMVGPFASVDEAKQLCASLKSAGAQCVVPLN